MKILATTLAALLMLSNTVLAENATAIKPLEYQLYLKNPVDTVIIKKAYAEYKVVFVVPISRSVYLLRLGNDPGKNITERIARTLPGFVRIHDNNLYSVDR